MCWPAFLYYPIQKKKKNLRSATMEMNTETTFSSSKLFSSAWLYSFAPLPSCERWTLLPTRPALQTRCELLTIGLFVLWWKWPSTNSSALLQRTAVRENFAHYWKVCEPFVALSGKNLERKYLTAVSQQSLQHIRTFSDGSSVPSLAEFLRCFSPIPPSQLGKTFPIMRELVGKAVGSKA